MTMTLMMMMTEREPEKLDSEEQKIAEIFAVLEETGAIELIGLDQTGEPVYRITEKCKDVFPEFYDMYRQEMSQTCYDLWHMGVVNVMFNTDTTISIYFTADNYSKYREVRETLTEQEMLFLEAVVGSSLADLDRRL